MVENKSKELSKDDSKQLKKLLDAHMLVASNKLGRTPSLEELMEMVKEEPEEQKTENAPVAQVENTPSDEESGDKEPDFLKLKVFYGMAHDPKDSTKTPDPHKVLFYETGDGRVFDTSEGSWLDKRPAVLNHLHSRPLLHDERGSDIIRAIAHGILSDEDVNLMESAGLLNEDSKRVHGLRQKAQQLSEQMQQLEKSEPVEVEPELASAPVDAQPERLTQESSSPLSEIMKTANVQSEDETRMIDPIEMQGNDLFEEIKRAALAHVDEKLRSIMREEIEAHLTPVVDALELVSRHVNLPLFDDQPELSGSEFEPETIE